MKRLLFSIAFLMLTLTTKAQTSPPIDTANYLSKSTATVVRTDTNATNLITYNQGTHVANLMGSSTLKSYFQNGLQKTLNPSTGISISGNTITNILPDQVVTITAGNGIAVTGTYPNFTIAQVTPTITFPTRAVNTAYTISTTKAAYAFYSIACTVTNPLLAGSSSATATLQYSTNGGTSYQDVAQSSNLSSVSLAVTIQLTNTQTGFIGGLIPANALVKITTSTTGTASISITKSTEFYY